MSRIKFAFVAVLVGTTFAGGISAEPDRPVQNPTSVKQYPLARSNVSDEVAVQAVHNFGSCIVSTTPQGAREALALDYRTAEYRQKLHAVAKGHEDRCLLNFSRLGTEEVLLAGALAEALVKAEVKPSQLAQRLAYDPKRQDIQARDDLEAMALCTVLRAPQATIALFDTEPATPDEIKAMGPLSDVLSDCLRKGAEVKLNPPAVRSLLALAAWRIVTTPQKAQVQ